MNNASDIGDTASRASGEVSIARNPRSSLPSSNSIPQTFAQVVRAFPERIALLSDGQSWSYAELDRISDHEAARLLATGVARGDCVGIHMARSAEAVIAMLAILKIGASYVPFDSAAPEHRLAAQAARASIRVMMVAGDQPAPAGFIGTIQSTAKRSNETAGDLAALDIHPLEIAYVIYTSGSTNEPKGVCISHRAVLDFIGGASYCGFLPEDVVAHGMSIAFDGCVFEIWGALLSGSCLAIVPPRASVNDLCDLVERDRISVMLLTAGFFNSLGHEALRRLARLRVLLSGGDVMSPLSARDFFACGGRVLINGYGPTEITTISHCHRMSSSTQSTDAIPIGAPISATAAYVLDDNLAPLPIGVEGELFIAGSGVAQGYLGDPALTAQRFLPDPFATDGSRMYRTGDLVRQSADGVLDYIGRIDTQVKIRGFRVELGEIETCLGALGGFIACSVVYVKNNNGAAALCAYCMPEHDAIVQTEGVVLDALRQHLPEYMIPRRIVYVDALPLTINGKVDRQQLEKRAKTECLESMQTRSESCTDELQQASIDTLKRLLGSSEIRLEDNFFDLGGDSLTAMRFCAAISDEHAIDLPLSVLFEAETLRTVTDRIRSLKQDVERERGRSSAQETA
ncbi:MAG: non-ribosomal peptide synthetase [Dokdonella sp.]